MERVTALEQRLAANRAAIDDAVGKWLSGIISEDGADRELASALRTSPASAARSASYARRVALARASAA